MRRSPIRAARSERRIKALIDAYDREQAVKLEQELFKQRKRLADAERTLQARPPRRRRESKRIATDKMDWALGKLADLRRTRWWTRTRASSRAGTRRCWSARAGGAW